MLKERHERAIEELGREEAEEFAAIESRVKLTVQKKDYRINELQEQLTMCQLKNRKLEELMEAQRRDLMKFT